MNKYKVLIGLLAIGLELFGSVTALGAKLPGQRVPASKQGIRPQALEIPPAEPAGPGMPCREARRWPKVTTYTGCDTPASKQANKAAHSSEDVQTFLRAHAHALRIRPDLSDLKVAKVKRGLSRTVTRYQQTFNNLPVLNAYVSIQQRPSGRVTTVHNSYISDPLMEGSATPMITQEAAETIALDGIGKLSGVSSPELLEKARAELSWYPIDEQSVTLVWVIKTRTLKPQGDFYTLVDANTGDRLLQENRIAFAVGTGMAYVPNPIQTSGILDLKDNWDETNLVLDEQRIAVELLGLDDSTDLLKGEFVDVASFNTLTCPRPSGRCPDAKSASRSYVYTRKQPQFEQVVIYQAIDSVQRYLRDTLGFEDATSGNALIRNFPTLANAHWNTVDNSFYSPFADNGRGALHFGDGGVDDAEDADIIVHEFGHAIQHDQNPGCFTGGDFEPLKKEAPAIGEGFSDYLAASFFAENEHGDPSHQALHAACVGEWDSSSYSRIPSCLRRVDGSKHYPEDLVGGDRPHPDGEIWSAALWDIRAELGGPTTDQLVLEHHFNLDCPGGLLTMPQAALEMIDTDNLLFAGAHELVLRTKFCDRGILEGSACDPSFEKTTIVSVQKDSTLVMNSPNRNEGASPELRVSGDEDNSMRIVLGFDLSNINLDSVATAKLVMTVQDNPGGWGMKGRNVAVRPLKSAGFVEGNGQWFGVPANLRTAGNGKGVTWNCETDNKIGNTVKNCPIVWNGKRSNLPTAAPFVHMNDLQSGDEVLWDVSDDVKGGATAWLVLKGSLRGEIAYFSKEGNAALAPRIEITFNPS
jgi:Zn-dependent metalloprotease